MSRAKYAVLALFHIICSPVGDEIIKRYTGNIYQDPPISLLYSSEDIEDEYAIARGRNVEKLTIDNLVMNHGGRLVWQR